MKKILYPALFAIFAIFIWNILKSLFSIPDYLLPSPQAILSSAVADSNYFIYHASITLLEAALGFTFAIFLGFFLGAIFAIFGAVEKMALPYAIASQAIPIVAIAPLFILWFGSGLASKVAMAMVLCFFPMVVNTTKGLRTVTPHHLALMKIYRATRWQTFWKLRFPASLPFVISGMKVSAALAMIGAIVAEYAGADRGIGYVIMQATYRLDTLQLFGGIFYSALGGLLIFGFVLLLDLIFSRYTNQYSIV